jgi:YVTN family beta-propeller protein
MHNDAKIQRRFIFLIILNIVVLVLAVALSNFTHAREPLELHQKTLDVISNHTSPSEQIAHITVGKNPTSITSGDEYRIYVANRADDTVSVIDEKNNTKIMDIKVGKSPGAIAVDESTHTIYAANYGDDTVSVIDAKANRVVAKVMFNIEPFNAGHIECDKGKKPPIAQQFYIWSNSECTAKPNQGFEFVSWQENLGGNSTQLIKFSSPPSIWDSF